MLHGPVLAVRRADGEPPALAGPGGVPLRAVEERRRRPDAGRAARRRRGPQRRAVRRAGRSSRSRTRSGATSRAARAIRSPARPTARATSASRRARQVTSTGSGHTGPVTPRASPTVHAPESVDAATAPTSPCYLTGAPGSPGRWSPSRMEATPSSSSTTVPDGRSSSRIDVIDSSKMGHWTVAVVDHRRRSRSRTISLRHDER